jgi:hypothetical protein
VSSRTTIQDGKRILSSMAQGVWKTPGDCPTLVVLKHEEEQKEQKVSDPNTPQESSDLEFYIMLYIKY